MARYTVKLSDEKERELKRFTLLMARRVCERTKKEIGDVPVEELIYEGLIDKDGLTPEAIADLIPFTESPQIWIQVMAAVVDKPVEELEEAGRKKAEEGAQGAENPIPAPSIGTNS